MLKFFLLLPFIALFIVLGVLGTTKINVPFLAILCFLTAALLLAFFIVGVVSDIQKKSILKKGYETTATIEAIIDQYAKKYEDHEITTPSEHGGYSFKLNYIDQNNKPQSGKTREIFIGKQAIYLKSLPSIKIKCNKNKFYVVEDLSSIK